MKRVLLLGSTGSIGRTTLRVLEELGHSHTLVGLAAGRNGSALVDQVRANPGLEAVAVADPSVAQDVQRALPEHKVLSGPDSAAQIVAKVKADVVVAGITGAAGLASSMATLESGADLALANKESMVLAGPVLSKLARERGARIIPVDSEHSAIYQCLQGQRLEAVRRIVLTASGGPFRTSTREQIANATPEQALDHPTWNMGAKITIDSASLMNKALEVIEARWLFDQPASKIAAVVHPQSIVHSMVEYRDGSILAQLGVPDMAVPIRYSLSYPERSETKDSYFDLERFSTLTFEAPDTDRFPSLSLGFEAARLGGLAGAVLNAANEVVVQRFLDRDISFPDIPRICAQVLGSMKQIEEPTLDQLLAADLWAREEAAG